MVLFIILYFLKILKEFIRKEVDKKSNDVLLV